jgi:hypothetical protein
MKRLLDNNETNLRLPNEVILYILFFLHRDIRSVERGDLHRFATIRALDGNYFLPKIDEWFRKGVEYIKKSLLNEMTDENILLFGGIKKVCLPFPSNPKTYTLISNGFTDDRYLSMRPITKHMTQNFSNLVELDITVTHDFSIKKMNKFWKYLPKLVTLTMEDAFIRKPHSFVLKTKALPNLRVLSIDGGFTINSGGINDLTRLEKLVMIFRWSTDRQMHFGLGNMTNLKVLKVSGNVISQDLTDESLGVLTQLVVLFLDTPSTISNEGLTKLTNLEHLYLAYNTKVTDEGLGRICSNMKSLHLLECSGVRGICFSYCSSLLHMALQFMNIVGDANLDKLTSLEYLMLDHNQQISNDGLVQLTQLKYLVIDGTSDFVDITGFENLVSLESIDFLDSTDVELSRLGKLTNLKHLYLPISEDEEEEFYELFKLPFKKDPNYFNPNGLSYFK